MKNDASASDSTEMTSASGQGLEAGDVIADRYRLIERLDGGEEKPAPIWSCVDRMSGGLWAIKLLELPPGLDSKTIDRLLQELDQVRRVVHPGLCRLFDAGFQAGLLYMTMERVPGESVQRRLEHGRLPPELVSLIARQVVEALGGAHTAHVLHGHLRPSQIMLRPDGRAVVLGLGWARLLDVRASTLSFSEPPAHAPPELLHGETLDMRSDVYGVALVTRQLLTGAVAPKRALATPLEVPGLSQATNTRLDAVLKRAVASHRETRFPSLQSFADALAAALSAAPPAPQSDGEPTAAAETALTPTAETHTATAAEHTASAQTHQSAPQAQQAAPDALVEVAPEIDDSTAGSMWQLGHSLAEEKQVPLDSGLFPDMSDIADDAAIADTAIANEASQNRKRYVLGREHARGGAGRILEAHDLRLNRPVAVKVLLRNNATMAARFWREAQVSARLQHPSIVPVYDIGRWPSGEPFYTMKLIAGHSLQDRLSHGETLDDRLLLLPQVLAVADAIAYAHSQRIIHRDLKPSNILVGDFGETVVIDWGLAKDLSGGEALAGSESGDPTPLQVLQEEDRRQEESPGPERPAGAGGPANEPDARSERAPTGRNTLVRAPGQRTSAELTSAGMIVGTAYYMPPEQALGNPVDERADVYSIGAILLQLLTGKPPYEGRSAQIVLQQVRRHASPLLQALGPEIPADLAAIVRKAMARRADDRYPSARELADDLRRYLNGQLVVAHEYTLVTLLGRWIKRYRVPIAMAGACLMILAGAAVYFVRNVVHERNIAELRSEELVRVQAASWLERDPTATLAWLKSLPPRALTRPETRELAMDAWSRGVAWQVLRKGQGRVSYGAFSPDGQRLAFADARHGLQVKDLATGKTEARLPLGGDLSLVRFLGDGQTLAFTEWESPILRLWQPRTGEQHELRHDRPIPLFDQSRDGHWLLVGSSEPMLSLWELPEARKQLLDGHQGLGVGIGVSPNGDRLAYSGADHTLHVVDLRSGGRMLLHGVEELPWGFAFSPDGQKIAAGGASGMLWVWDLGRPEPRARALRGHSGMIRALQFAPDGLALVSGGDDRSVRVWDLATGTSRTLGEHLREVHSVAFSPDGSVLASGSADGMVRLWWPERGAEQVLRGHTEAVDLIEFSADSRRLMTAGFDRTTRIWHLPPAPSRMLQADAGRHSGLMFSPEGQLLVVAGRGGSVRLWEPATGQVVQRHMGDKPLHVARISPDGTTLAAAGVSGEIGLWRLHSNNGAPTHVLRGHQTIVWTLAYSPDGTRLASASLDGQVRLWDVKTGASQVLSGHHKGVRTVAFSPDGRLLATAGDESEVRLWSTRDGTSRVLAGHRRSVSEVAFSPDGGWLASASQDGTVRLWEVASGEARLLTRSAAGINTVVFSPDGQQLAAAGEDAVLRLCPVQPGECQNLVGHLERIAEARFSNDGRLLVTASADATLRVWSVTAGACIDLHRHDGALAGAVFSPDDRYIASSSEDKTVRLWEVSQAPAVPLAAEDFRLWLDTATTATLSNNMPTTTDRF